MVSSCRVAKLVMWVQGQRQQLEEAAVGRMQEDISQEVEARRKQLQVPSLPGTMCCVNAGSKGPTQCPPLMSVSSSMLLPLALTSLSLCCTADLSLSC